MVTIRRLLLELALEGDDTTIERLKNVQQAADGLKESLVQVSNASTDALEAFGRFQGVSFPRVDPTGGAGFGAGFLSSFQTVVEQFKTLSSEAQVSTEKSAEYLMKYLEGPGGGSSLPGAVGGRPKRGTDAWKKRRAESIAVIEQMVSVSKRARTIEPIADQIKQAIIEGVAQAREVVAQKAESAAPTIARRRSGVRPEDVEAYQPAEEYERPQAFETLIRETQRQTAEMRRQNAQMMEEIKRRDEEQRRKIEEQGASQQQAISRAMEEARQSQVEAEARATRARKTTAGEDDDISRTIKARTLMSQAPVMPETEDVTEWTNVASKSPSDYLPPAAAAAKLPSPPEMEETEQWNREQRPVVESREIIRRIQKEHQFTQPQLQELRESTARREQITKRGFAIPLEERARARAKSIQSKMQEYGENLKKRAISGLSKITRGFIQPAEEYLKQMPQTSAEKGVEEVAKDIVKNYNITFNNPVVKGDDDIQKLKEELVQALRNL